MRRLSSLVIMPFYASALKYIQAHMASVSRNMQLHHVDASNIMHYVDAPRCMQNACAPTHKLNIDI